VAEANLRATKAEVEDGPDYAGGGGSTPCERREPAHAPRLVDEPSNRHADEDRRLLDGADTAAVIESREILQRQRDALVRHGAAAVQHVVRDPCRRVPIGNGVGIAHADVDARRIVIAAKQGPKRLRPERPVELLRFAPRLRQHRERQHLLLPRRQLEPEAPHELGRRRFHQGVRRVVLFLLGDDDDVQLRVRIARTEQRAERIRDLRLLERRNEMHEHRRVGSLLQRRFVGQVVESRVRVFDQADRREHPAPVEQELERRAEVEKPGDDKEREPGPLHGRRLSGAARGT
jgi:hypothetical protein